MANKKDKKAISRVREEAEELQRILDEKIPRTQREIEAAKERERYRLNAISDKIKEDDESEYKQIINNKKYPNMDKECYLACQMIAQGYTYTQAGMAYITKYKEMKPEEIKDWHRLNIRKYIQNRGGAELIEHFRKKRLRAIINYEEQADEIYTRICEYAGFISNDDKTSMKEKMKINAFVFGLATKKEELEIKRSELMKDRNTLVNITQVVGDSKKAIQTKIDDKGEAIETMEVDVDYVVLPPEIERA